jgi:hypothetical protein
MQNKLLGPETTASQELIRDLRILGDLDPDAMDQLAEALNSIPENLTQETVAIAIQTLIRHAKSDPDLLASSLKLLTFLWRSRGRMELDEAGTISELRRNVLPRQQTDNQLRDRTSAPESEDEIFKLFQSELAAFNQVLPSLINTRPGKYIAMTGGEIVDEDDDEIVLAERIESRYPRQFVLIRRAVLVEPEEHLPSPEVEF